MKRWLRRRRFQKAYEILRDEHKRHVDVGHEAYFKGTNEAQLSIYCVNCPDLSPAPVSPEDARPITRDHLGNTYRS